MNRRKILQVEVLHIMSGGWVNVAGWRVVWGSGALGKEVVLKGLIHECSIQITTFPKLLFYTYFSGKGLYIPFLF